jgi:hypothetical protein
MMKMKSAVVLTSVAVLAGGAVHASENRGTALPILLAQSIPEEPVYGSQMMTEQERNEHRAQLRAAKSEEEREQIRRAHHDHMRQRAQERGMTLPDEPPARGGGTGLGPGPGAGPGTGPGGGAGPGRGR